MDDFIRDSDCIKVSGCECVQNAYVYGLKNSIRGAKFPMAVDIDSLTTDVTHGIRNLAQCEKGTGHDQWLTGVIVQFDLTFTNKAWVEAERYTFLNFVSSQSTMHRITKFDIDSNCNEYVDQRVKDVVKGLVEQYNNEDDADLRRELYLKILYNNPAGFKLTARMTANYRQLKTIYAQRRRHRLPEWRAFCKWMETLPNSEFITGRNEYTTKVFAISGQARHGKDTTAKLFAKKLEKMGYKVLIAHYADLLKYICTKFFGWNGLKDARGRTLLQQVGTNKVRRAKPNFWVDFIVEILKMFDDEWDYVIIPDTRFPNELDRLSDAGFEVTHIKVERPHFDNGLTPEQLSHPSETALYGTIPDLTITNDGSVSDLKGKIDKWIEENVNGKT